MTNQILYFLISGSRRVGPAPCNESSSNMQGVVVFDCISSPR